MEQEGRVDHLHNIIKKLLVKLEKSLTIVTRVTSLFKSPFLRVTKELLQGVKPLGYANIPQNESR